MYSANQYNYATPLSSVAHFLDEVSYVSDAKYFTLHDNTLDGSCKVISGDIGLWGASLANADGVLAEPFIVTITDTTQITAVRIVGSQYSYPVAFTIKFYNGSTLLHTITETSNSGPVYIGKLPKTLTITSYVITITKISSNTVVRLYNSYNLPYVSRVDTTRYKLVEAATVTQGAYLNSSDELNVAVAGTVKPFTYMIKSSDVLKPVVNGSTSVLNSLVSTDVLKSRMLRVTHITNSIDTTYDTVRLKHSNLSALVNTIDVTHDILSSGIHDDVPYITNIIDVTHDNLYCSPLEEPTLTNIHTVMKSPFRQVYGKVYIVYNDPMIPTTHHVEVSTEAYNSNADQVLTDVHDINTKYFTLYENDLSGEYSLIGSSDHVGWTSGVVTGADGRFAEAQRIRIDVSSRPVKRLTIHFNTARGAVPKDFTVTLITEDGTAVVKQYKDNTESHIIIDEEIVLSGVIISVESMTKAGVPVVLNSIPLVATILYNDDRLISIDMLEELSYEDDVEAIGGMSSNEVTVVLDNSNREFLYNSKSLASTQLRRNRKIEPWLGAEVVPGEIEWHKLGTYWSYRWNVPTEGLTATVVGFDTISLLDLTTFTEHDVFIDASIGSLIEYVLDNAAKNLTFIRYKIDKALYDIVIPYAWFDVSSHAEALRKISKCYPMHIYCDRDGVINASPQKLHLDYYLDTWADDTNVYSKSYSSLHTAMPNIVNVSVTQHKLVYNDQLANSNDVIIVPATRTLTFNKPYVRDLIVNIDSDETVQSSYKVHSWGIEFTFSGSGEVRNIECIGTSLDKEDAKVYTYRDDYSVMTNGAITRNIQSDFIQTEALANDILSRYVSIAAFDKYDATVKYRGDIALSINDPILLQGGVAPDNRYTIRRHQLSWDGSLTGSAELNT